MPADKEDHPLATFCKALRDDLGERLRWRLDDRFDCVLGELRNELIGAAESIVEAHFNELWETSTIHSAPKAVHGIANNFSSLRAGQRLYTSTDGLGTLVYCAWWPWGGGDTVSVRIGLSATDPTGSPDLPSLSKLAGWFGIA